MRTDNDGACLLLDGDNGCGVYEDRPTVCRYYPVALLNMREKDTYEARQQYSLVQEDHRATKRRARSRSATTARSRGVAEYDEFNRSWYELILKKKSGGLGVGKPNEMSLQLFFMASFNFDMLRRFVLSDNFKQSYNLPPETYAEVAEDDIALIKLGNR